jgi:hypothetical protein
LLGDDLCSFSRRRRRPFYGWNISVCDFCINCVF